MTLNPNYEAIGKAFTEQYYLMFDNPATRSVRSITFLGFFLPDTNKNRIFLKFGFSSQKTFVFLVSYLLK